MPGNGAHCLPLPPRAILTGPFSGIMCGANANPLTAIGFQSYVILAILLPERGHLAFKQVLGTRCEAISGGRTPGSFPSCIFLWDAFSAGPTGKMQQAPELIRCFSCPCSHASLNFSEESLFQLESPILPLPKE